MWITINIITLHKINIIHEYPVICIPEVKFTVWFSRNDINSRNMDISNVRHRCFIAFHFCRAQPHTAVSRHCTCCLIAKCTLYMILNKVYSTLSRLGILAFDTHVGAYRLVFRAPDILYSFYFLIPFLISRHGNLRLLWSYPISNFYKFVIS